MSAGAARAAEFRAGWRNLLAATIGLASGVPCYTPVSSLFFRQLSQEFGWSRTAAAGALVALPITAAMLPLVGWLIDRLGVKLVTACSAAGLVLGFAWLARLNGSVSEFYLALIALNVLGCATGPIGYTRLVAARFRHSRGQALAVAQFGIALFAVLLPLILGSVMTTYGWRGGYWVLAVFSLGGGLVAQLLMRAERGLPEQRDETGIDVKAAVRTKVFWLLGGSLLAISTASLGLVSQFQSVLIEKGLSGTTSMQLLSLLAISVMVTRLLVGRLLDLRRPERWAACVLASAGGGCLLLALSSHLSMIVLAVLLIGSSIGSELDFIAFFCAREFGMRRYASIYGLLAMFFYSGIALGGIGYGALRDHLGSYDPALYSSGILLGISGLLLLRLGWRSLPIQAVVD